MQKGKYILIFILFQVSVFAQNLDYKITFIGFDIGSFSVKQKKDNNKLTIIVDGQGVINMLKSYIIKFYSKSVFGNNKLISAISYRYQNGEKTDSVFVEKKIYAYKIFSFDDGERYVSDIKNTGNMLYFNEPFDNQEIFSENKGRFITIKKIGEHKYFSYDEKKGEKITYEYKNNLLIRTIFERGFVTLTMKLKQ